MNTVCRRDSFTTNGPQAARKALNALYGVEMTFHDLTTGDTLSMSHAEIGPVCVTRINSPAEFRWHVPPLHRLVICQPLAGVQKRQGPGVNDRLGPGDVAIFAPPDRSMRGANHSLTNLAVSIDLDLLAEVAANDPEQPMSAARHFGDCRPLKRTDVEHWGKVVDFVGGQVFPDDRAMASPLIRHSAVRLLAGTALTLFPNTAVCGPTAIDRGDATPRTLRRALDFIEAHVAEEISVAHIAAAAQVTVRAVQLSFRQHLGTTPLNHLRMVRLMRAHEDLRAADSGAGDTVTEIAARWGFFSPGRFSAQYRQTFGVSPSRTLRT